MRFGSRRRAPDQVVRALVTVPAKPPVTDLRQAGEEHHVPDVPAVVPLTARHPVIVHVREAVGNSKTKSTII